MKAASVSEIKQELLTVAPDKLLGICLRLAKYKKDNKELLTYLLFEAHDLPSYISGIKKDMDEQFASINQSNLYFAKKSLRKILRSTGRYIQHTGSGQVEVELLLYFCSLLIRSNIRIDRSTALLNLFTGQLRKIKKTLGTLHEDLQHDYLKELKKLET